MMKTSRRIDPEDALCIDYMPAHPLPAARIVSTPASLIAADRAELAFVEAKIAAGATYLEDAAQCLRVRIAALEAL